MTSVPVTVVSGLEEALDYVLKVFAINSDGMGPPATETFRTLGIGELYKFVTVSPHIGPV